MGYYLIPFRHFTVSEISSFKSLVFLSHIFFPLPFFKSPCSALIRNFPLGCLCLEYLYSIILPSSSQTWLSFVYPVSMYWSFNLSFSLLIKLLFSFSGGWRLKVSFSPILRDSSTFFSVSLLLIRLHPEVESSQHLLWRRTGLCPHERSKVTTPCIAPEAADAVRAAYVPPATRTGDPRQRCLHLCAWGTSFLARDLGPGLPRRAGVRTHFRWRVPRPASAWRAAVRAPLAQQSPGVSVKLHLRCRSGPSTPATLLRPISIFLPRFRAIWPMAPLAHTPKAAEPRGGFLAGRDPCRPARTKEVF